MNIYVIYKIEYPNAKVVQFKQLIHHEDYLKANAIVDEDEYKAELYRLSNGNEWFTDQSSLFNAISTHIVRGGDGQFYPCNVTLINS